MSPRWVPLAAAVLHRLVGLLGGSCRYRMVDAEGAPLDAAAALAALTGMVGSAEEPGDAGGTPRILSFWHQQLFLAAHLLSRRVIPLGHPVTVLVSRSRDGELGARVAERWRAGVVRGSTSRGGSEGLRRLYRAVRRERSSAVIVPDGPRGPARQAKPGTVVLAQMAGVPIQPLAFAPAAAWRLESWDRMLIPRPFTRVAVAVGAPISLPAFGAAGNDALGGPETGDPEAGDPVAAASRRLTAELDRLAEVAAAAVRRR